MLIHSLRNDKGEYISMSGGRTKNWLEASKFDSSEIDSRLEYTNPEFKLVSFDVKEVKFTKNELISVKAEDVLSEK